MFRGRDVISIKDLSRQDIEHVLKVAGSMERFSVEKDKSAPLRGCILASLFFQPSTRTRLSFESAMHKLGGAVIGFASAEVTRAGDVFKETLADTARMVGGYADVIAVRSPDPQAPRVFADHAAIPVISAGAGTTSTSAKAVAGEHPTQTLLDLYTISKIRKRIDGLKLAFMGNLGTRAVHSMGYALSKFKDVHVHLIHPPNLGLPDVVRKEFDAMGLSYEEATGLGEVIEDLDALYMTSTRVAMNLEKTDEAYSVSLDKLKKARPDMMVLHPLPRMDEISCDVDGSNHATYFIQAQNGVYARMAVLALVLGAIPE